MDAPQQRTAGSQTPTPAQSTPAATVAVSEPPPIDACALLTSEEIATVQGAAVVSTTPSSRNDSGVPIAQCYFQLPSTPDSLSLIVYKKPADPSAKAPLVYWNDMFHTERPPKTGRDGKPKTQPTPQKIEGVGDEAFWGGGQFGGTLHVRKGQDVFQLSVGGPGDEAKKLEALKQLAGKVAERL